jgi:hypothetical protein
MRKAVVLLAALAIVGALAGTASAALWLVFSRTTVAPRDVVSARTGGRVAIGRAARAGARKHPLRLFLVDQAAASSVTSVRDPRLVPLGRLAVDRKGNGRIQFTVPNVPPGDYTTLLYCVTCRRYSANRTILPVGPFPGPFHVTEAAPVVRDCSTSVYGDLPADWRQHSVSAGPLSLYPIPERPPERISAGRYRPVKLIAMIQQGASATLTVPLSERSVVALAYRPPAWTSAMRVSDGDAATTLSGCAPDETGNDTQFNGGFVVAGARCAHFEVRIDGRADSLLLEIPFGAPC